MASETDTESMQQEISAPERVRTAALDAASRLFAERGIHAVSVREIAREIGVSHTLLHLYFGSKEEILRQVLRRHHGGWSGPVVAGDDMAEVVAQIFRHSCADPYLTRVLASALIEGVVPDQIQAVPEMQKALVERLDESLPGGDARALCAALSSMAIGWAVAGKWMSDAHGITGDEEEEFLERMTDVVRRLIASYA